MRTRVTFAIALVACGAIGAAIGLGAFTFVYARGSSYLGRDPAACANCHVMESTTRRGASRATTPRRSATTATRLRAASRSIASRRSTGTFALRGRALDAVTALIAELAAARLAGRPDAELAGPRALHRQAQFYVDFVEAENSMGFHAPGEALRILAISIDLARQGQLALRGTPPPAPPAPAPATPAPGAPGPAVPAK